MSVFLQATSSSSPKAISTEVSITALNPKIICFTKIGADSWVEMKKDGLKIGVKLGIVQH